MARVEPPWPTAPAFPEEPIGPRAVPADEGSPAAEPFDTLLHESASGVVVVDADGTIRDTNDAFSGMLGYGRDELRGLQLADLAHPMDSARDRHLIHEVARGEQREARARTRLLGKSGGLVRVQVTAFPLPDRTGAVELVAVIVEDGSDARDAEETLHRLATTDELTGLFNRRGFLLLAELQWRIARRNHRPLLVVYADVDGLKEVNDTLGHAAGDALLVEAAGVLRSICRESDVVARVGGDEFVILALEAEETTGAIFRQRLDRVLAARSGEADARFALSLSVGVAHVGPDTEGTVEEILMAADAEMYESKRRARGGSGGGTVRPPLPPGTVDRLRERVEALTAALEEVAAQALANSSYEERLVRIHRRAVTALTRPDATDEPA